MVITSGDVLVAVICVDFGFIGSEHKIRPQTEINHILSPFSGNTAYGTLKARVNQGGSPMFNYSFYDPLVRMHHAELEQEAARHAQARRCPAVRSKWRDVTFKFVANLWRG